METGATNSRSKCKLCMFISSPMPITQMLEHPNKVNGYHSSSQAAPSLMRSTPRQNWVCPRCIDAVLQQELCNTTMIVLTCTACFTTSANLWMILLEPKAEIVMFQTHIFLDNATFFPIRKNPSRPSTTYSTYQQFA